MDARLKTLWRSKLGMLTTHWEKRTVDVSLLVSRNLFPMMRQFVNPYPGKTTDWRAVCGKSACTVRREGEQDALPTPISPIIVSGGTDVAPANSPLGLRPSAAKVLKNAAGDVCFDSW